MRVPLKWLRDYVPVRIPEKELAHRLTMAGLEVKSVDRLGGSWENIFVGRVLDVEAHPNADRLRLVTVDLGEERHRVICGAPNVAPEQKIAFATLGAKLVDGRTGESTVLKKAKIRGVESAGMVCSEKELGLSEEHEGILVLGDDAPVGMPLASYLGDVVFEIDMKPNRADGLSILGVARDVAALTGEKVVEPELDFASEGGAIEKRAGVTIEATDLCFRFTAAVIEGIEIRPSPPWMQERLLAAGMRPINNVVDITNYVMLELGQPIHAFDYDAVKEHHIIVRRARPGETLTTLDGIERTLGPEQLLITDPGGAIAVAGVMGGLATEVTEKTRNILLEVATFHPVSIRRTAMGLKLPSEASRRFAWGLPTELAPLASRRATKLLVELAGGKAARGMIDAFPVKPETVRIDFHKKRLVQVLGIDLPESTTRETLEALGFDVSVKGDGLLEVQVPYWRRDVKIPDDLVEEVARVVGYDEIPTEPLAGRVPPHVVQPERDLRERVRDVLAQAGMQEILTYPLTSIEALEKVIPPSTLSREPPLAVINPLNVGEERLRTSLRASMLGAVATNQRVQAARFALFETARVYMPRPESEGPQPRELELAAGAVSGRRLDRWGRPTEEWIDFFDAKGYVERLFDRLGVVAEYVEMEEYGLVPGRTAQIRVGDERVGIIGQVHPRTARVFDIEQDVFLFEVSLEALLPHVPPVRRYEPLTRFPRVIEDLAVVVDRDVPAARIIKEILGHSLVASAELFDEYEGEQVPKGKKSLAVSIAYQAPDRTLSDKEVGKVRERIVDRLRRELGAELRS